MSSDDHEEPEDEESAGEGSRASGAPSEHEHGPDCDHEHDHDHAQGPRTEVDPARYEGVEGFAIRETSQAGREILAVLPWERFVDVETAQARKLARQAQLPGFRKGKVPLARIRSLYASQIREETTEALVQETWKAAQESAQIKPVGNPLLEEISVRDGEPVRFAARFEVLPAVELAGLDELRVDDKVVKIGDADVEEEIERLREMRAELIDSDRDEAAPGDIVQIDLYRFAPGTAIGSDEPVEVKEGILVEVGSEHAAPELDRALLGMGVGEMREFSTKPKEGEPVPGRVLLKGVKERKLPEADDAFAQGLKAGFETIGALREDVGRRLVEARRADAEAEQDQQVVEHLLDRNPCEIPSALVEQEAESRIRRAIQGMAQRGLDVENPSIDWAAEFQRAKQHAEKALRADYLLELASDLREIEVGDDDVAQELEAEAKRRGVPAGQLRAEIIKSKRMNEFRQSVRRRRTLDSLKAGATVSIE